MLQATNRLRAPHLNLVAQMDSSDTLPEERRASAALFARFLRQAVEVRLRGKWYEVHFNPDAIDPTRSDSIVEFRRREWPGPYRLSIHSDHRPGSLVGYGVFQRQRGRPRSAEDEELSNHLRTRVRGDEPTPVHWIWYRQMSDPLCDFAQNETLVEAEKVRRGQPSGAASAFEQAVDDLVSLAEALDEWYSERRPTRR